MGSPLTFDDLLDAMKRAAAVLRDEAIPFALGGSLAVYARGGPETNHDVDFVLTPEDAERALDVLGASGFRCERPPEGWLYKVFDEREAMVDLIFSPSDQTPDAVHGMLERAGELDVYAIRIPVLDPTDVLASKLLALREHALDYAPAVEIARALREQIDWKLLAERTAESPYAAAFLTLVRELELTQP